MGLDACVVLALTPSKHAHDFSICLFMIMHSFILPSPLMTCQARSWSPRGPAHRMGKFADHGRHLRLCPGPFLLSLLFPCKEGRLGGEERASDTAQMLRF